jgi:hypothetical protein
MYDEKRFLREWKRFVKRRGNRSRRRYLKNIENEASGFDYGRGKSAEFNKPHRVREQNDHSQ